MAHRGLIAGLAVLVLLSSVPIFRIVNVNFTPQDDQSRVRRQPARARGHQPRGDRGDREPRGHRHPPDSRGELHDGHRGGRFRRHAEHRRHLCAAEGLGERDRDQFVIMDEVRNEVLPPVAKTGVRATLQAPGSGGGGGGGGQAQGDVMFVMQGPSSTSCSAPATSWRSRRVRFPGWWTWTPRCDAASRKCPCASTGPRPPTSACSSRMPRKRCGCSWAAIRSRPTTRRASSTEVHLRAEGQNRDSEAAIGRLTVPSARLGSVRARKHRRLHPRRGRRRHPPPESSAPGDAWPPTCCRARRRARRRR